MKMSDSEEFEIVDPLEVAKDVMADKKPDLAKIKAWLKPTDYAASSGEFKRHLSSQSPGTGEWIRETAQFSQWHSSDNHGSIWIKAVPGAGKSVVAASMVDSLARQESVPVLFFFFRQIIESNRTARSLLRDWLCQLLPSSAVVQAALWEVAEQDVDLESIPTKQLWKYLLSGLRAVERAYCVVDALDEMSTDQEFLSQLNDLGTFRPAHVKVLMTSRPKQYLQRALRDPQVIHVALEEELVTRDVSIFAGQRVALLEQYDVDGDTQEFIKQSVLERSTGLFLYARLMLDQIEKSLAQKDNNQPFSLQDMITQLPMGLEDMYNKVLSDVSTSSKVTPQTQGFILSLVTQSARPLRLIEIAHALGPKHGDSTGSRSNKDIVRTACGPLLEIMDDEVVQILHHSFTEFLQDTTRNERASNTPSIPQFLVLDPVVNHSEIAITCLSYLQSAKFDDPPKHECGSDYSKLYFEYPFYAYSATNWTHHAARCSFGASLLDKLEAFCSIENPRFEQWVRFTDEVVFDRALHEKPWMRPTPLQIASCFGLTPWAKILVQNGANVDDRDSNQPTALFLAAHHGFSEIVELLLEAGASPDLDRYDGLKPLHAAARRNHAAVVKLLMNAVSPTTPKTRDWGSEYAPTSVGDHPLMYAVIRGHLEAVIEMIPFADTPALNDALCWAASRGHTSILRSILERSETSANAIGSMPQWSMSEAIESFPALMLAVRSKEPQCVKSLLDHGAHVHKADEESRDRGHSVVRGMLWKTDRTALHEFASQNFESTEAASVILESLVAAGANLEARDYQGNTPLLLNKSIVTLNLLIEAGADVCASDRNGETVLHRACSSRSDLSGNTFPYRTCPYATTVETVALLLASGANPRAVRQPDGATPFHCAANCHPPGIMKLLLENGADINTKDSSGNTALHRVILSNSSETTEKTKGLIDLGADVNVQNDFGQTCLHVLTIKAQHLHDIDTYKNTARMLIDAGADLQLTDHEGLTVLLCAVKHLSHLVDIFLEYPSKISIHSCVPATGKSVLHVACQYKQPWATIKTLVNSGADPFVVDHNGNTLLHEIAQHYISIAQDAEVIEELVKLGVSIHARNFQGRSAIHLANRIRFEKSHHAALWTRDTFLDVVGRLDGTLDVNSRDIEGYTPLHFATVVSEAQAYALIRAGADLRAKAKNLRTPLHCAARARQPNIISMILHYASEQGLVLDINAADEDGRTALHDASRSGIPESVKFLLNAGADVNKPDNDGVSPLVACTEFPSENALWQVLVQRAISTEANLVDDFRFTQTHRLSVTWQILDFKASEEERTKVNSAAVDVVASILVKAGATGARTALDKALSARCAELVYVLRQAVDASVKKNPLEPEQFLMDFIHRGHVGNRPSFQETALMLPITNMNLVLEKYKDIDPKEMVTSFGSELSEALMDAFLANNIDLISTSSDSHSRGNPVIQTLVRNGRTDLMRKLLEKAKSGEDQKFSDALHAAVRNVTGHCSDRKDLLWIACQRATDNMEMVKLLVEDFELDVNAKHLREKLNDISQQDSFTTALHSLASGRSWWHPEAIRYLAGHGAVIDILNGSRKTPLELVCERFIHNDSYNHGCAFAPHCAEMLLKLGADPNRVNAEGLTPLNVVRKDIAMARVFIKYGADPGKGPKTAIISATELGAVELLKLYLEEGSDCNKVDMSPKASRALGWNRNSDPIIVSPITVNPLLIAALPRTGDIHNTSVEMTRLLLKHGAKLDVEVSETQTLLHYIVEYSTDPDVFAVFLENKAVDFGLRDQTGRTAFMAACGLHRAYWKFQGPKAKSILIAESSIHGPAINYQTVDNYGNHALMHLIPSWTSEISDFFLNKTEVRALIHQKNKKGFSPLHQALKYNKYSACDAFLAAGADITAPDPDGNTALHCICNPDHRDSFPAAIPLFTTYLARGGSINARNVRGETPLLVFVGDSFSDDEDDSDRYAAQLALFASHGADFAAVGNDGRTVLHIVAAYEDESHESSKEVFGALVACGADPLQEDGEGRTALDLAAAVGNVHVLGLYQRPGQETAEAAYGKARRRGSLNHTRI